MQNQFSVFSSQISHAFDTSLDKLQLSDVASEDNFLRNSKREDRGKYIVSLPFCDSENVNCALGHSPKKGQSAENQIWLRDPKVSRS